MKEIIIKLEEATSKPIAIVNGLRCLIDTGADIPVATYPESVLKEMGAVEKISDCYIKGFGGYSKGKVWAIPMFMLGDIIYPNIHVFVPEDDFFDFDFIISSSMLYGLVYEFDMINYNLLIKVPDNEQVVRNVKIIKKDGTLAVLVNN